MGMKTRDGKSDEPEAASRKIRAVRYLQELFLEADAYWQLPEMFLMVLRTLDDVLGFKQSMIYLLNDDGETLGFQSGWGYPDGYVGGQVRVGEGFVGMSARTGKVLRMGDLRKGFRYMRSVYARTNALSAASGRPEEPLHGQGPGPGQGRLEPESLMSVPSKNVQICLYRHSNAHMDNSVTDLSVHAFLLLAI